MSIARNSARYIGMKIGRKWIQFVATYMYNPNLAVRNANSLLLTWKLLCVRLYMISPILHICGLNGVEMITFFFFRLLISTFISIFSHLWLLVVELVHLFQYFPSVFENKCISRATYYWSLAVYWLKGFLANSHVLHIPWGIIWRIPAIL